MVLVILRAWLVSMSLVTAAGGDAPEAAGAGGAVHPPEQLAACFNELRYTPEARERGIEGVVVLRARIDKQGGVVDVEVVRGLGYGLDERAIEALRACSFAPARRKEDGEPVEADYTLTASYRLSAAGPPRSKAAEPQAAGGRPSESKDIEPPEQISSCFGDMRYSESARSARLQGKVLLKAVIDTEGRAREITVLKTLGMGLDEIAIEAMERCRFKPARRRSDGEPVEVYYTLAVNFRLAGMQPPEEKLTEAKPIGACLERLAYTEDARQHGIEGTVILQGRVDKKGRLRDAKVIKRLGHGLDEVALEGFKACRFEPARKLSNGKPADTTISVTVHFKPPEE